MDEKGVRHLLHELQCSVQGASYTGSVKRTRWLNISCPFAQWTHSSGADHSPSFGITLDDKGPSGYKCFACNVKGKLSGLPTKLGGYRKKDYSKLRMWAELSEMQARADIPLPAWDSPELDVAIDYKPTDKAEQPRPDHPDDAGYPWALGVPYLRKRGIDWLTTLRIGLRYDELQQRVLFPVWDRYDAFAGFTGRSTRPGNDATRGRDPKVKDYFGLPKREVLLGLRGPQPGRKIISEGLFDFGRAQAYGYRNARAILGTSITDEKADLLIADGEPVFFFMDNDLAGWQALFGIPDEEGDGYNTANAWAFRLYREIPVWIVPYRTHMDGLDPGSITDKRLYDWMVKKAWLFTGDAPLDAMGEPTFCLP